jgi:hypothetical protein
MAKCDVSKGKLASNQERGEVVRNAFTLAAAALATCGVVSAPAGIASADTSAAATIAQLESQGYTVNVDRVGSGPIDKCTVTSVRNPNTQTQLIRVGGRGPNGQRELGESVLVPVIISQTVQVSLYCAR